MFPNSSQKKYWLYRDEKDIANLRQEANALFIAKHGGSMSVSFIKSFTYLLFYLLRIC